MDVPFHYLAAFIGSCVEVRGSASATSLLQPCLLRILAFMADTDDLAAPQLLAVLPRAIRTIYAHHGRTLPRAARSGPPDADLVEQGKQIRRVAGLTFRDQDGQRAAFSFAQHVDLAVSSPSADAEPFVRECPPSFQLGWLFPCAHRAAVGFATGIVEGGTVLLNDHRLKPEGLKAQGSGLKVRLQTPYAPNTSCQLCKSFQF